MIAAAQAHEELEVAIGDGYVDVFAALRLQGVEVMGKEMGGLLGLYVDAAEGGPSCLLNIGLEEVAMRHTIAHELGHHRLGHGTSYDHQEPASGRWGEGWPQHERDAEAFASWFLMPRPAVQTALARCGLTRPGSPQDVYRMARWLGTPYATTVRHLVRLKMIDRTKEAAWLKMPPSAVKAELARGLSLGAAGHVHVLAGAAQEAVVHAQAGDLLLLRLPGARFEQVPTGLSLQAPHRSGQLSLIDVPDSDSAGQVLWVGEDFVGPSAVRATSPAGSDIFQVAVHRVPDRSGCNYYHD